MSYYMGDDYRGDPGLFGSIGKAFGSSLSKGAPIMSAIAPVFPGGSLVAKATSKVANLMAPIKKVGSVVVGAAAKHPVLTAAGAAGAGAVMGAGAESAMVHMGGGGCGRGGHGRVLKHCGQILKSGKCGKCHRRMNPFNPYAARRSARRLHSLTRHYRKYIGFVSARKPKGRPFFKRRKK